jgi:hypothetical protein
MKLFKTVTALMALCFLNAAFAVQLENWRSPFYQEAELLTNRGSSPSTMFWDDFGGESFLNPALRPDSGRFQRNHWIVEPSVSFSSRPTDTLFIDTTPPVSHYVNDRSRAQESQTTGSYWTGQVLSDIRYKNILVRQVLDVDSRNKTDLDFRGKTDRFAAGRIDEAYLQVDWKYGFFRLGRLNRNWGPFPDRSLLLSSNTHSYDAVEWQVASSFFEFRQMFTAFPLATSFIDAEGSDTYRYLTAHSLNFMFGGFGSAGITETMLFSRPSGLPDLQLVNPFSLYTVINTNGEADGNLMLGFQWDIHPFVSNVSLKGQILLDDFQVDNKGPADQEPTDWGGDFGAYWTNFLPLKMPHILSIEYRYLSRWLYNVSPGNEILGQRYMYLGRSLGYPTDDGDCFNLSFFMTGNNYWAGTGGVRFTRQGENSLWTPWKNLSADSLIAPGALGYRTEKSFPSGIVESMFDLYIDARGYFKNYADIRFQFDNRWIKNKNNLATPSAAYDPRVSLTASFHYCDFFIPLPK